MSYRKLGDLVKFVSNKNTDGNATVLFGINIDKFFMPSVANIIGVDLKKYKVVERHQFACNRMHVGRDERLPISMSTFDYNFIVSPAYDVFEVITSDVLPEYLMLWFRRKEFDRQCWFYTDADVRGGLHLDALKSIEIKVPSIEEQRQIVAQYHSISNKIKVNEQICEKLEATAQALYKHWFVDFEFPVGHCEESGTNDKAIPALVAEERSLYATAPKGYKSSGGKMVWNEELAKEIPEGWEVGILKDIFDNFDSKRKPITASDRIKEKGLYPYYGAAALMDYIDDYIFDGTYILLGEDGTVMNNDGSPVLQYVWGKFWVNNHAHVLKGKNGFDENSLYLLLKNTNVSDIITGGVQLKINQGNLNNLSIIKPSENLLLAFNKEIYTKFEIIKNYKEQNQKLTQLQSLLLSRLAVGEEVSA